MSNKGAIIRLDGNRSLDPDQIESLFYNLSPEVIASIEYFEEPFDKLDMVEKTTHSGVAYGFIASMLIGFVRQWWFLGQTHQLLREVKTLFSIPDGQM